MSISMKYNTFTKPTTTRVGQLCLTVFLLAITTVDANATIMICTTTKCTAIEKISYPSFHRPVLTSEMGDSIWSNTVAAENVAGETSTRNFIPLDIFSQLMAVKNEKLGGKSNLATNDNTIIITAADFASKMCTNERGQGDRHVSPKTDCPPDGVLDTMVVTNSVGTLVGGTLVNIINIINNDDLFETKM